MYQIAYLSQYVLTDARRTGLHWILLCGAFACYTLGQFLSQLGITENQDIQVVSTAAAIRLVFVFIVAVWICAHCIREQQDQSIHLLMALPIRRSEFVLGKLFALAIIAPCAASIATLVIVIIAPQRAALLWGLSLGLEMWLVSAFALFCASGMRNLTSALATIVAFYTVGRSIAAMVLMAHAEPVVNTGVADFAIATLVSLLAYLLPPLDQYTQSSWLVYGITANGNWPDLLIQSLVYSGLLGLATIWDLQRKQL